MMIRTTAYIILILLCAVVQVTWAQTDQGSEQQMARRVDMTYALSKAEKIVPPDTLLPKLALRTNLLYDLALVPNIGVEWFIDQHWSVAANVMYVWAKNDTRHRYWRILSADVEGRYWLRPQTCDVQTGHHFGLYAGFYRYDFEFGGRGWMGNANYGGGMSYGYALRLFPKWRERFTLDLNLGLGYLGGTHKEYIPDQGCYVWQRTVRHHLFIPTKAEVTLMWYPRWSFFNKKKGGDR